VAVKSPISKSFSRACHMPPDLSHDGGSKGKIRDEMSILHTIDALVLVRANVS
jgi:hypothetical protein